MNKTAKSLVRLNFVIDAFKLFAWILFRPSAWRNYLASIDPDLPSDFCLTELSRSQWHNPTLRRLLVSQALCLLAINALLGVILILLGMPLELIVTILTFSIAFAAAFSISGSLVVGIIGGIVIDFILAGGLFGGLVVGVALLFISRGTSTLEVLSNSTVGIMGAFVGCLMLSFIGGTLSSLANSKSSHSFRSFTSSVGYLIIIALLVIVVTGIIAIFTSVVSMSAFFDFVSSLNDFLTEIGLGRNLLGGWSTNIGMLIGVFVITSVMVVIVMGIGSAYRLHARDRHKPFKITVGVASGMASIMAFAVAAIIVAFAIVGILVKTLNQIALGMMIGVIIGVGISTLFALPYAMAERRVGSQVGAITGALVSSSAWIILFIYVADSLPPWLITLSGSVGILLGLSLFLWRPLIFWPMQVAWSYLLLRADKRNSSGHGSLLNLHPAFWDEYQRLPLFSLDEHIVLTFQRSPAEGQAAIEYLSLSPQRWATQAAQVELDARRLEGCADLTAISRAHHSLYAEELAGPASALLRSLSRISQDVTAALNQGSSYNQRLSLNAIEDRLDALLRELTRSSERYAMRFRPIAMQWRQVVSEQVSTLVAEVEQRHEIDNPYVISVPLTEQQEIFVGRTEISAYIEQLLLDRRSPLLLYGQRRMGKTSLLNNLGRLLPSTIVPLFVDLQGASLASDHAGFLYNLGRGMRASAQRQRNLAFSPLTREQLSDDPFTRFDEWLDEVEKSLGNGTALLILDEFEVLNAPIAEGRFNETRVLGMLRNLIQHRLRFKVLLAGSHTLDELQSWASYLINVQVVHLSYLKEAEARQLIEQPVKDFALRYEPDASQRILQLTHCHPYLIQLLCAEIVALKNEQESPLRQLVCLSDVEAAVADALSHGSFSFMDIEHNQVDNAGLKLLNFLAAQGEKAIIDPKMIIPHFPNGLDDILALLVQRDLIESVGGGYRFQVELIRQWFARV